MLAFKPNEDYKGISIYSTIDIGTIAVPGICPLSVFFYGTAEGVDPEICEKCFHGGSFTKSSPWILQVQRKTFKNGLNETMFIRIEAISSLNDWKREVFEAQVTYYNLSIFFCLC